MTPIGEMMNNIIISNQILITKKFLFMIINEILSKFYLISLPLFHFCINIFDKIFIVLFIFINIRSFVKKTRDRYNKMAM